MQEKLSPKDEKFLSELLAQTQEKMENAETDFQIRLYCRVIVLLEQYIKS